MKGRKIFNAYRGYKEFLTFEEEVYSKKALKDSIVILDPPAKKDFKNQEDFIEEKLNIYTNSMAKIANLIESGLLPVNTKIILYITSPANQDFKKITDALKSGKCPINFQLIIYFSSDNFRLDNNNKAKRIRKSALIDFQINWVPHLVDVFQSNKCPIGLKIDLKDIRCNKEIDNEIHEAHKIYRLWDYYQQRSARMLEFYKGKQSNENIASMPHELLSLICYYYFLLEPKLISKIIEVKNVDKIEHKKVNIIEHYPVNPFYPVILLKTTMNFLEKYNGWNLEFASWFPSENSRIYKDVMEITVKSNLSLEEKVINIQKSSFAFFKQLKCDEYTESKAIKTALHCNLIDKRFIEENPQKAGEYKLSDIYINKRF